jgi:hypothetical protein
MVSRLERLFPGLAGSDYHITSPWDGHYNCIAWAAGDTREWWWPNPTPGEEYWPPGVPRVRTLDAFRDAFATLGYVVCIEGGSKDVQKANNYERGEAAVQPC